MLHQTSSSKRKAIGVNFRKEALDIVLRYKTSDESFASAVNRIILSADPREFQILERLSVSLSNVMETSRILLGNRYKYVVESFYKNLLPEDIAYFNERFGFSFLPNFKKNEIYRTRS